MRLGRRKYGWNGTRLALLQIVSRVQIMFGKDGRRSSYNKHEMGEVVLLQDQQRSAKFSALERKHDYGTIVLSREGCDEV